MRLILFLFIVIGCQYVVAKPHGGRTKRFSDQHLADLETRIALNTKYNGIAITMPVGGGKYGVDPWKLGRKRRSEPRRVDQLFKTQEEDEGDPSQPTPLSYEELLFLAKIGLMSLKNKF
ncbi:uncharacterized protein LOC123320806 [Coccinella septempunctata]|uniref:uncharacterized protein LOC123320806 n=1 Tax=Coccinella septempunctata TaxID=41139 RepID=UPI001D084FDF|nr:uncharacterized protein LOC123320806 [Coccinella septempunctata]